MRHRAAVHAHRSSRQNSGQPFHQEEFGSNLPLRLPVALSCQGLQGSIDADLMPGAFNLAGIKYPDRQMKQIAGLACAGMLRISVGVARQQPTAGTVGLRSMGVHFLGFLGPCSMSTDDLLRAQRKTMIGRRCPRASVLAMHMPVNSIEPAPTPALGHQDRAGRAVEGADLLVHAGSPESRREQRGAATSVHPARYPGSVRSPRNPRDLASAAGQCCQGNGPCPERFYPLQLQHVAVQAVAPEPAAGQDIQRRWKADPCIQQTPWRR